MNNDVYQYDLHTDGTLYGGFAGYNFQNGNFVYGGEVSYMLGELADPDTLHTVTTEQHLDAKLRLGYAVNDLLLFGFGGYSIAMMYEDGDAEPMQLSGMNYGVGVDYLFNDKFIIGADYTIRDLSGDFDQNAFPGWSTAGPVSTIAVRAGVKF